MDTRLFSEDGLHSPTPCSSPDMNSGDDLSDTSSNIPQSIVNAANYITVKEGCQSAFTIEELTIAIDKCKRLVLDSEECSEERKWFVRRLIELRHRLQQAKESEESKVIQNPEESLVKLGHHFKLEYLPATATEKYCDRCCRTIWNVVQSYYLCFDCQYRCHIKCVESINRVCVHLVMSEEPHYQDKICPEVGLDSQGYRCYECDTPISYSVSKGYYPFFSDSTVSEARLCNYSGHHYCPSCHWNTFSIIPARIMSNWDFEPRKVCRSSYQLLRITKSRPLIILDERLERFIDELAIIKKKREELGLMKQYIATCRPSLESGLVMRELEWRRHLVHSTTVFSLDDLCDIHSGTFFSKLETIYNVLRNHITVDCAVCRGRGYICELCDKGEVIFGFDTNTYTCPKCDTVSHKMCWSKKKVCKKCLRKEQKLEQD